VLAMVVASKKFNVAAPRGLLVVRGPTPYQADNT
jgi:hypothetical protein